KAEFRANPHCQARFDLSLRVTEANGCLELHCQYSRELFDAVTIERWLRHYETLLAAAAANPNESIGRLPILGSTEREQIVNDWVRWRSRLSQTLPPTLARLFPALQDADGAASADYRVYVLDWNLQLSPIGVPGELYISAPCSLINGQACSGG